MSFSADVKKELCEHMGSARHCQIAELEAFLIFCATVRIRNDGEYRIDLETEHADVADKYQMLIEYIFHEEPEIGIVTGSGHRKNDLYRVEISDSDLAIRILQSVRILDGNKEFEESTTLAHQLTLQKSCCRRAFLRGAFLAGGSISDPNRSYHFEILCESEDLAAELAELIQSLGIEAKIVMRKKYHVVYVKESEQISDLLGLMEATGSLLNFENIRVVREVRGNINRKVNCETANINKTANAAARQIEDIRFIEQTTGLFNLPNGLDEMARIRLQYPTATLAELGKLLNPPVGKSGVNHRLRKLSAYADALREEQGGNSHNG